MYGAFGFAIFPTSYMCTQTKFIVPEAHFHTESISASPVVIARKTAKLFKFLHLPTQRNRTIQWRSAASLQTSASNSRVQASDLRVLACHSRV